MFLCDYEDVSGTFCHNSKRHSIMIIAQQVCALDTSVAVAGKHKSR